MQVSLEIQTMHSGSLLTSNIYSIFSHLANLEAHAKIKLLQVATALYKKPYDKDRKTATMLYNSILHHILSSTDNHAVINLYKHN